MLSTRTRGSKAAIVVEFAPDAETVGRTTVGLATARTLSAVPNSASAAVPTRSVSGMSRNDLDTGYEDSTATTTKRGCAEHSRARHRVPGHERQSRNVSPRAPVRV